MAQLNNICAPTQPRCGTTNYPLFQLPISDRRIPECSPPTCPQECTGGNAALHPTNFGTLDRSRWIEGWIIRQLFTRGRVECEEHYLNKRDGGWWADSFRSDSFSSGSKLWSLKWGRVNNETLILAKRYAADALQPLLAWGVVATLIVGARYVSHSVLQITVAITGPGVSRDLAFQGSAMPNSTWLWEEYRPGAATTMIPISQRALVA